MPTLTLDGEEVEFEPGMTVIQVCEQAGVEIPRFCYHEKLEIAGNCRMCLVEVSPGPPKPAASCALPAADGMTVSTKSEMVKKAREGVMEFLLINHPLDCPICDQGGECDLQDQSIYFGSAESRYKEHKRAVEPKEMGPLIKTHMTRCIHCTRCVRFAEDVAGVPQLGALNRGEDTEITTYLEKALDSEMSANVIDLCPVGALTSRPYAFVARPWELTKTESIDVMDAVGSNIRVDSRGEAVMRVLPRLNEEINEEWISDKTRYACDGLLSQRLDCPYVRNKDGALKEASWDEAFDAIAEKANAIEPEQIGAVAGNLACMESMMALKDLMGQLGSPNLDCRQEGAKIDHNDRASYIFNTTIQGIEYADALLLVGTNPRWEAPLINSRIRKSYLKRHLQQIANVGLPNDLTYPVTELGNNPTVLNKILAGEHEFSEVLKQAQNPMVILGSTSLAREDGSAILNACKAIAEDYNMIRDDWNGFNMLHYAAARVGGLDLGFVPGEGGKDLPEMVEAIDRDEVKMMFLLGVDEIDMEYFGDAFIVYQGHHGDIGAQRADVILPAAAYTEKNALYTNTEGRLQEASRAVFPPGDAKEDWKILRALSEKLGEALPYDSHEALRKRMMRELADTSAKDDIVPAPWQKVAKRPKSFRIKSEEFERTVLNFYMTDPISRSSKTMAECTRELVAPKVMAKTQEAA